MYIPTLNEGTWSRGFSVASVRRNKTFSHRQGTHCIHSFIHSITAREIAAIVMCIYLSTSILYEVETERLLCQYRRHLKENCSFNRDRSTSIGDVFIYLNANVSFVVILWLKSYVAKKAYTKSLKCKTSTSSFEFCAKLYLELTCESN